LSTTLLSGRTLAGLMQQRAHDDARDLETEGLRPTLAVVVATDDGSTQWYVRSIERAAESAGISCRIVDLGHDATAQALASVLKDLSN
jgi:methylenetetrahydrofolate dehydrogenase (NADP+)/methenyltetrahydrofolate cyclohydrolase